MKRKAKRGSQYERVVAAVLRAMDPRSKVRRGQWVSGPDGRRELDVLVEGNADGQGRRVLIECKDYSPKKTGPVGIQHVDALESKRRDMQADVAIICSNAGFTTQAVHKASRVGIDLISVMRRGDKRIRFAVTQEMYVRKVKVEELNISLQGPEPICLSGVRFDDVIFEGAPVGNWIVRRAMTLIGSNPIVAGSYAGTYPLRSPLEFTLPSGPVTVSQVDFNLRISGGWYAQQVTLDTTHGGMYDWLRHCVRMAPGHFLINVVDINAGKLIDRPPDRMLHGERNLPTGHLLVKLLLITGLEPREPIPDLNSHVVLEDLDPLIKDLPAEAYTSVRA